MGYKIIVGLIKFYFVSSILVMFANIITYASADMLLFVQCNESYLYTLFASPEPPTDEFASEAVSYFMRTAISSVPGEAYFDDVLGLFLDGANGNIFTFIENVSNSKNIVNTLELGFTDYAPYFLRDISVATLASFVIFVVIDLKDKVVGRKSLAMFLGFACSLFFWILSGYTFGNCLVTALEQRVIEGDRITLYTILIIIAVGVEATVHSFAKKCPPLRLIILALVKILLNIIKAFLTWLMCTSITTYFSLQNLSSLIFLSLLFLLFSAVEMNTSKWAETGKSFIKLK